MFAGRKALRMHDTTTKDKKIRRLEAMRAIDAFLSHHQFGQYRRCTNEQFAKHAQSLVRCSRIIYGNDLPRVSAHLDEIAKEVEECELHDYSADGHHLRAADAIRARAKSNEDENAPWHDLLPLLSDCHVQRKLATSLWNRNVSRSDSWKVLLDRVMADVWDEDVPLSTVRTSVTRLKSFCADHGCHLEISVKASNSPAVIACRLISLCSERIEDAVDERDCIQKAEVEARKKEIDDQREARRLAEEKAYHQRTSRRIRPNF